MPRDGLSGPERLWLLRAAAYRELAPACEAEQRQLADALPDAVGPVRRGHRLTTRQAEQLLVEWRQRQRGRVARFERDAQDWTEGRVGACVAHHG